MRYDYFYICNVCGYVIEDEFCVHCGNKKMELSEDVRIQLECNNSIPKYTYKVKCCKCGKTHVFNSYIEKFIKYCISCGSDELEIEDERVYRRFCYKCGYELKGEYCSHCGSEQKKRLNLDLEDGNINYLIKCNQCNTSIECRQYVANNTNVCSECGSKDITKYDIRKKRKNCVVCGHIISGNYCSHCGTENSLKDDTIIKILDTKLDGTLIEYTCTSCGNTFENKYKNCVYCSHCGSEKIRIIGEKSDLIDDWLIGQW